MVSTMTNQEKTKEALAKIETALQNINTDADWLQYLAFQAKFYRYSARNALLIRAQNPEARYVKGYKAWRELDRFVKKGAKGIAILAPCIKKVEEYKEPADKSEYQDKKGEKVTKNVLCGFTVKYVFDIADTDGSDEHIPVLVKGLSGDSEAEQALYERIKAVIAAQGHTIREVTGTASKGSYNLITKVISVRSDMEALQRIKTLLHEYGHLEDFTMNPDENISRPHRELVAESVAYIVAHRLGLDVSWYSSGYLASWGGEAGELAVVADTAQKVAMKIIDTLAESEDFAFLI